MVLVVLYPGMRPAGIHSLARETSVRIEESCGATQRATNWALANFFPQ